jgi:hypothetical protein
VHACTLDAIRDAGEAGLRSNARCSWQAGRVAAAAGGDRLEALRKSPRVHAAAVCWIRLQLNAFR